MISHVSLTQAKIPKGASNEAIIEAVAGLLDDTEHQVLCQEWDWSGLQIHPLDQVVGRFIWTCGQDDRLNNYDYTYIETETDLIFAVVWAWSD